MKSGTERNQNPHEARLGKFLRAIARPVRVGYVYLRNGQIVRRDTFERWKAQGKAQ